ncbi:MULTISPECIES: HEPN domain-containing protein [Paraburkholderia]|uniref:HEPN domain-containing protein n=1 Tax=Paraburkholderia TaxID=1822464 RepID=UPI0022554421|nr:MULTISPECIES: HEPN domain-containing protein [Paraburkholderia]MCX4166286.1 HEPN domain-containing protein [Paraburkholderia megapolitana]MDN7161776.1 HEPN domain-containing protein [Paraburkholderia sp. CHISQ3]MDQ6498824.1 HEPN domain-containing protein [Paraburkholderia megapolitana]
MSLDIAALAHAIDSDLTSDPAMYTESPYYGRLGLTAHQTSATQRFLESNEFTKKYLGEKIYHCSGSTIVNAWALASCALTFAKEVSPQKAAETIDAMLKATDAPVNDIALLSGIVVSKIHKISNNIWLAPISDAPSNQIKGAVTEHSEFMKYMVGRSVSPFFDNFFDSPRTVLWRRRSMRFGFKVTNEGVVDAGVEQLFELSHLLTLVGPCSPSIRQYATELDESIPLKRYLSQTTYMHSEETKTNQITELGDEDIENYRVIVNDFSRLNDNVKNFLYTPLVRLNLAIKHISEVEKAIDLGIAMESLFLSDGDKNAPIALPLRLRGAWLLGETEEERENLYGKFQKLYDLRSSAVHSGSLGKGKQDKSNADLLADGVRLCVSAILKIIKNGAMPKWTKLILGGRN